MGDQDTLHERHVEVFQNDVHQPFPDLDLARVPEPSWVDLTEHLFGGFQDFHPPFGQSLLAQLAFGGVDDGVQPKMIDPIQIVDRLKAKVPNLDR